MNRLSDGLPAEILEDSTLAFYEAHAHEYSRRTLDADLTDVQQRFARRLSPGARILDLGCGPGRDLRAFSRLGFMPIGLDASPSLVRIAREVSGSPVSVGRIEEIEFDHEFDGIWACASLLHVARPALSETLARIRSALRPGGTFFASVQEGAGDSRAPDGRSFTYFEERAFRMALGRSGFKETDVWRTADSLREGRQLSWLNFLSA
ncbi:MAG TPA: class I SAM-dependent methyltransferase [Ideonella sp.]|uniref:class I SAM-dependent methyltransferase n=1 Tax=Ideonella sp. TaxID=1929293 RepID=UPI002BB4AF31|nr:class I SAM-dependent methyltransferase [Ideonella sp.]HSI51883.1 class I SAM-dependent methyltransferase [Ideonella sp.]